MGARQASSDVARGVSDVYASVQDALPFYLDAEVTDLKKRGLEIVRFRRVTNMVAYIGFDAAIQTLSEQLLAPDLLVPRSF